MQNTPTARITKPLTMFPKVPFLIRFDLVKVINYAILLVDLNDETVDLCL